MSLCGIKRIVNAFSRSFDSTGKTFFKESFDLPGHAVEFSDEQQFTAATANAAAYGWLVALIAELEKANCNAGLTSDQARKMVTQTVASAASVASETEGDLGQLPSSLATPGGITEEGAHYGNEKVWMTGMMPFSKFSGG